MFDLNKLSNNSVLICPTEIKEQLVKELSKTYPLKHVKFISKKELVDNAFYTYDYKSIIYLSGKYGYSYQISEEILENLAFDDSKNRKISKMYDIYLDLKEQNKLKENGLYKYLFTNSLTYVYGYSKFDYELINSLNKLEINYEFIEDNSFSYTHNVYKYASIEDEVKALFINIMKLVEKNISLNNIYLYQLPEEYINIVSKYARYHNIKISGLNKSCLYDSPIYKKYLKFLELNSNPKEAYKLLCDEVNFDPLGVLEKLSNILIDIIDIFKEYDDSFKTFLDFIAKKTPLKEIGYDNEIKVCDYKKILNSSDHVFLLGFSLDKYPKIYQDTDFYSDREKEYLGKNTSKLKNIIEEEMLCSFITNTKNVHISYRVKQGKRKYFPSLIIGKLNLNILDGVITNQRYSQKLSELEVSDYLDMKKRYSIDNEYINTFDKKQIGYESFSHLFSGLVDENSEFIKLSPTSITEFNNCPFKYYSNRVLKIGEFESTFALKLGNIFHLILQDSLTNDIDLDNYKDVIEKDFTTSKEKILLKNLLPQVLEVINKNKGFINDSSFKTQIAEKEIEVDIDEKSKLYGKIDKVVINNESKELIVVDYKTGKFYYDKRKNIYGIDLQLPIYSLLLNTEYKDYANVGMYIQNICLSKKELLEKNANPYYLVGITLKDDDAVKRLDNNLGHFDCDGNLIQKSQYIKSIKIKKDLCLDSRSGMLKDEYEGLKDVANQMVLETLDKIRNNEFDISPIKFNNQMDLPCKYCDYKDVCFMQDSDVRHIDLGGGDDDETN